MDNYMKLEFLAKSENEGFARSAVAAFVARLDPTVEEICDIKTAVSEAVTNAVIHGYEKKSGNVMLTTYIKGSEVTIIVEDFGIGMNDVSKCREPLYTGKPEFERSGMGFTVMESFTDECLVHSVPNIGTRVTMIKMIGDKSE